MMSTKDIFTHDFKRYRINCISRLDTRKVFNIIIYRPLVFDQLVGIYINILKHIVNITH